MSNPEKLPVKPYERDPALTKYLEKLEAGLEAMRQDSFFNQEREIEQTRVD